MQELDEEIKLHNAGGEDAPDTSDVSALFLDRKRPLCISYISKSYCFLFAADQQLDGEDS